MTRKEWCDIKGYEGLYQVNKIGEVRSLDRKVKGKWHHLRFFQGKILQSIYDKHGYCKVNLSKDGNPKQTSIHRLVCYAFIDNPKEYPDVNHIDGDKKNNSVDNLEWCTCQYNNAHAYKTGLNCGRKGENNPCAKLKEPEVLEILRILDSGEKNQTQIAKIFKVDPSTISNIKNRKIWTHVNS